MVRVALGIEYDGTDFAGWQQQTGRITIQAAVEYAVSKVADHAVNVLCAGRTDAGVHAFEQVVHFETTAIRRHEAWVMGSNTLLPDTIRVKWALPVSNQFHARYSAIARHYRYIVLNSKTRSALLRNQVTWCYQPLDEMKMFNAAQSLVGEHDFSSFRAQGCQSKSPFRTLHWIDVRRQDDQITIDVVANAFLYHMVRNIAGVLLDIGAGKQAPDWVNYLLAVKDRRLAAATAGSEGLYLAGIFYPDQFGLPKKPVFDILPTGVKRFL
ncbi:MAG: tRNA pseudouridine(38-40) synthase TruA [Methylococcaceae bacterium]